LGGALISILRKQDHRGLRGVDIKPFDQWYQRFDDVENLSMDLNLKENCEWAAEGASKIYNLAANMGGMGFIEAVSSFPAPACPDSESPAAPAVAPLLTLEKYPVAASQAFRSPP
jgi:hypothetical protein